MKPSQQEQLMRQYPTIADLRARARKQIPHISWEYLDCGTGDERALARNLDSMGNVTLVPRFMRGEFHPEVGTALCGRTYDAPFGVAPVGVCGLMWPQAEKILARMAAKYTIPFCLSHVATQTPETIGPMVGDMGWFQLYPPRTRELRSDILRRVRQANFHTLVVTADVPAPGRRERTIRAGLHVPPRVTPRFVWEAMRHPGWTAGTMRTGLPRLRTMEPYAKSAKMDDVVAFVEENLGCGMSWDYLEQVRDEWHGTLILKGILHPADAERALQAGVDGIQVSNHGARQLDAVPAAIDLLPAIVRQVGGKAAILFDSGVRSGLDIARALALGADFVMLGRAFVYAVAALGAKGADHAAEILLAELKNNMVQLGCLTLAELHGLAAPNSARLPCP